MSLHLHHCSCQLDMPTTQGTSVFDCTILICVCIVGVRVRVCVCTCACMCMYMRACVYGVCMCIYMSIPVYMCEYKQLSTYVQLTVQPISPAKLK